MMHHEYSWCIMCAQDASWVLIMHHEYSWCIMSTHIMHHEYPWCIMSTQDESWVLIMHHECSWCIMSTHDAPWALIMHHEYLEYKFLKPRSGIRFVTKWDAMEVESFLTIPISMICRRPSLQISRFTGFDSLCFWMCNLAFYFVSIWEHPGSTQRPPRISLEVDGVSKNHFGCLQRWSDFSKIPKIIKTRLSCVFRDSFRRKSEESMRNGCPVISQPSAYIDKTTLKLHLKFPWDSV